MISQPFFFLWPASFEVKKYIKIWSEASSFMWFLDISLAVVHFQYFINTMYQSITEDYKTGWKQHGWMLSQRPFGLIRLDVSVQSKVQPNNKISQSDTHSTQKLPWMLSCTQWLPLQELKQPKQGHAHFRKKMGVLPQRRRCEMNFIWLCCCVHLYVPPLMWLYL